jgi:hypothetical protein
MGATTHAVRIRGQDHSVGRDDVIAVAQRETPRRVNAYYVEIDGRRFPPKQLLRGAIPSAGDFDTSLAIRALRTLGFEVVKLGA